MHRWRSDSHRRCCSARRGPRGRTNGRRRRWERRCEHLARIAGGGPWHRWRHWRRGRWSYLCSCHGHRRWGHRGCTRCAWCCSRGRCGCRCCWLLRWLLLLFPGHAGPERWTAGCAWQWMLSWPASSSMRRGSWSDTGSSWRTGCASCGGSSCCCSCSFGLGFARRLLWCSCRRRWRAGRRGRRWHERRRGRRTHGRYSWRHRHSIRPERRCSRHDAKGRCRAVRRARHRAVRCRRTILR